MIIKHIIKNTATRLGLLFKQKVPLAKDTILVNTDSWSKFNCALFNTNIDISTVPIDLISPNDYSKIVGYIGSIDKKYLKRLQRLQWLQIPSHGFNGYDVANLYSNNDVVVCRCANLFAEAIAQYCISAYYMFNTYAFRRCCSSSKNDIISGCNIIDKVNVLIVGLGNIGLCLAQRCNNMNWSVSGVKRNISSNFPNYINAVYTFDEVQEHLSDFDYVINLLPETDQTKGIYDYNFFKRLKPGSLFCNVGRASAVVEKDLLKAINDGLIGGAILDVSDSISSGKNIIVTPHISWKSDNNQDSINEFFTSQLLRYLNGLELQHKVDLV